MASYQADLPLNRIIVNPSRGKPCERLVSSIKQVGVLEPILVRKVGDYYTIINGTLRYLACRKLKKKTIPCIVHYTYGVKRFGSWWSVIAYDDEVVAFFKSKSLAVAWSKDA